MSVLNDKKEEITAFCEANGIEYLGVFGSYARGDYRPDSDVDLLVEFEEIVDLIEFISISHQLEDILGANVDLVTPDGLSDYIKENVLNDLTPVYGKR